MRQSLRDAILALDIFDPQPQSGWPVSGLILNFKEFRQYSDKEITNELEQMELEGLVVRRTAADKIEDWTSTEAGQIAKEKQLQATGQRASALCKHANGDLSDLILALVACRNINPGEYERVKTSKKALQIYFFSRSHSEIAGSIDSLMKHGYIRSGIGSNILISAIGIQHYENYVAKRLGLTESQCLLAAPEQKDNHKTSESPELSSTPSTTIGANQPVLVNYGNALVNFGHNASIDGNYQGTSKPSEKAKASASPTADTSKQPNANPEAVANEELKLQLQTDYTRFKGSKVFWAAIFTLLPSLLALKIHFLHLKFSPASIVYLIYHGLGIYLWVEVHQGLAVSSFDLAKWQMLYKLSKVHHKIAWAVLVLIAATGIARGSIEFYGSHEFRLPELVYQILGVRPPNEDEKPEVKKSVQITLPVPQPTKAQGTSPQEKSSPVVQDNTICPYKEWTDPASQMVFVRVCSGQFDMGSPEEDAFVKQRSKPVHKVRISKFWIGKYEVSNREYSNANSKGHISLYDDPDLPVTGVSWKEAEKYCKDLGYRLPTEAQWEYAARDAEGRRYPWSGKDQEPTDILAVYKSPNRNKPGPDPVKSHKEGAGPFGTFNQAGNVWEWVRDCVDDKGYLDTKGNLLPQNGTSIDTMTDPSVDYEGCPFRGVRGGSYENEPTWLRSTVRGRGRPSGDRENYLGFRCVSDSTSATKPKSETED